ncbi:MAG: NACHT domain-containing protein [Rickettsiales bacterium]|nr:NACHT domain-containing protein [Rickettsiales bacterium]
MILTYIKKLKIFHDTFIEYCLEEIVRNRKISDEVDVPYLPTPLENSLRFTSRVPILRETSDFIVLFDSFRRTYNERSDATKIVNNLFPLNQITSIKQILSSAILDIAIEMESSIDEGKVPQDISKLAALTMLKLFGIIKSGSLEVDQLNKQYIVEAVSKKQGWLESIFLSQTPSAKESRNYNFISAIDLRAYLSGKDDGISLSSFIRQRYKLHEDIQIVIQGEIPEDIIATGIDISYKGLNGYEFDSEIFRIDRVESIILTHENELVELERKLTKYKAAIEEQKSILESHSEQIAKHEGRLNIHESLIQQALVSSRTEEENPISLSKRLKHLYALQDIIPSLIEDELVPEQKMDDYYINLQILLGDKASGDKLPITVETIFDRLKNSPIEVEKILILGGPGIGKSTLLSNIAHRWGKEEILPQFKYAFKIRLNLLLTDWKKEYLYAGEDLIKNPLKYFIHYSLMQDIHLFSEQEDLTITVSEVASVIQSHINEALFQFTGYDEVAQLTTQTGIVKNIIANIFRLKYIILDSRKNALTSHYEKRFDRYIENEGFSHDGTREYIEKFFDKLKKTLSDPSEIDKVEIRKQHLLDLLERNSNVRELAATPLNIALLCLISSDEHQAIDRFTHNFNLGMLYKEVIIWLGKRYITKTDPKIVIDVNTDPQAVLDSEMFKSFEVFKALKTIAYDSFIDNKSVFEGRFIAKRATAARLNIVDVNKFGLLRVDNVGKAKDPNDLFNRDHAFIHLSFQEYLTAHHLVDQLLLPVDDLRSRNAAEFIANHRNEPRYLNILKFAVGLIANQEDELAVRKFWEAILCNIDGVIEIGIDNKITLLMYLLEQSKIDGEIDSRIPYLEKIKELIDVVVALDITKFHDHIIQSGYSSPKIIEAVLAIVDLNYQWQIEYAEEVIRAQGEFTSIAIFYLKKVLNISDQSDISRSLAKEVLIRNKIYFIEEDIVSEKDRVTTLRNIDLQTAIKMALELVKRNNIAAQELMSKILVILHYPGWQVKRVAIKMVEQLIINKSNLIEVNVEIAKKVINIIQWHITDDNLKEEVFNLIDLFEANIEKLVPDGFTTYLVRIITTQVAIQNKAKNIEEFIKNYPALPDFHLVAQDSVNSLIIQFNHHNWLQRYIAAFLLKKFINERFELVTKDLCDFVVQKLYDLDIDVGKQVISILETIIIKKPNLIDFTQLETLSDVDVHKDAHVISTKFNFIKLVAMYLPHLIRAKLVDSLVNQYVYHTTCSSYDLRFHISSTIVTILKVRPDLIKLSDKVLDGIFGQERYNKDIRSGATGIILAVVEVKPECLEYYIIKLLPTGLFPLLKDRWSGIRRDAFNIIKILSENRNDFDTERLISSFISIINEEYHYHQNEDILYLLQNILERNSDIVSSNTIIKLAALVINKKNSVRVIAVKILKNISVARIDLINIERLIENFEKNILDNQQNIFFNMAHNKDHRILGAVISDNNIQLINPSIIKFLLINISHKEAYVRASCSWILESLILYRGDIVDDSLVITLEQNLSSYDSALVSITASIIGKIATIKAELINLSIIRQIICTISNKNFEDKDISVETLHIIANGRIDFKREIFHITKTQLVEYIFWQWKVLKPIAIDLPELLDSSLINNFVENLRNLNDDIKSTVVVAISEISTLKADLLSASVVDHILDLFKTSLTEELESIVIKELKHIASNNPNLINSDKLNLLVQYLDRKILNLFEAIYSENQGLINVNNLINKEPSSVTIGLIKIIYFINPCFITSEVISFLLNNFCHKYCKSQAINTFCLILSNAPELATIKLNDLIEKLFIINGWEVLKIEKHELIKSFDTQVKILKSLNLIYTKDLKSDIKASTHNKHNIRNFIDTYKYCEELSELTIILENGRDEDRLISINRILQILEEEKGLSLNNKIMNSILKILGDKYSNVRVQAAKCFGVIALYQPEFLTGTVINMLLEKLKNHASWQERQTVADVFKEISSNSPFLITSIIIDDLGHRLDDDDLMVREAATKAIGVISSNRFDLITFKVLNKLIDSLLCNRIVKQSSQVTDIIILNRIDLFVSSESLYRLLGLLKNNDGYSEIASKVICAIVFNKPDIIDIKTLRYLTSNLIAHDKINHDIFRVLIVIGFTIPKLLIVLLDESAQYVRWFTNKIFILLLSNEEQSIIKIDAIFSIIAFYDPNDNEKKDLITLAKKVLNFKLDTITSAEIIWITDNYGDLLKLSYETPLFFNKLFHKVLGFEQITEVERKFIIKAIEHGVATSTTNKASIIFEGKVYKIGSSRELYLAGIRAAILAQEDDILVRQYLEHRPIFPNTGIALRIADYDNSHLIRYEKQALFYKEIDSLQELLSKYSEVEDFYRMSKADVSRSLMSIDDPSQHSATVTLFSEPSHRLHKDNALELIRMINHNEIESDTVICLERKQNGNNLGMRDVVLFANILRYSEVVLPNSLTSSPIYYDAMLYNIARDKGILVLGIEGKGLEHSKNSPYYHTTREEYIASKLYEISSFGRNSIFLVGSSHIEGLKQITSDTVAVINHKYSVPYAISNESPTDNVDSQEVPEITQSSFMLSSFVGYLFNGVDVAWQVKKFIYYQDILKFNAILKNNGIDQSINILKDYSYFRKSILLKLHPDKGGKTEDFAFVKDLQEKFTKDLDIDKLLNDKIQEVQPLTYKTTIGFKIIDTAVDTARLLYEPTLDNTKKLALDTTYIYSLYSGVNGYSIYINAVDIFYKSYHGEYVQAAQQAASTAFYMALPSMLEFTEVPYIGFAYGASMAVYNGYIAITNAYSFYLDYNSKKSELKSAIAYRDITKTLSIWPLQQFYDFAKVSKEYEIKINNINLEQEKLQTQQQLKKEKGEFGQKLYEHIYSRVIDEKYDLQNNKNSERFKTKHIKVMEYDHCVEVVEFKEEELEHYYCYNKEQEMLDHIIIIGNTYVNKIDSL